MQGENVLWHEGLQRTLNTQDNHVPLAKAHVFQAGSLARTALQRLGKGVQVVCGDDLGGIRARGLQRQPSNAAAQPLPLSACARVYLFCSAC